jgi:hypothetical protein
MKKRLRKKLLSQPVPIMNCISVGKIDIMYGYADIPSSNIKFYYPISYDAEEYIAYDFDGHFAELNGTFTGYDSQIEKLMMEYKDSILHDRGKRMFHRPAYHTNQFGSSCNRHALYISHRTS